MREKNQWSWRNVRLIFMREVRDQLRDRRTLLLIGVLPLVLYPMMGMSFFQVAQFLKQSPTRVLLLGEEHLPQMPALVAGRHFGSEYFATEAEAGLLELIRPAEANLPASASPEQAIALGVATGEYQAVMVVPPDFTRSVDAFRESIVSGEAAQENTAGGLPSLGLHFSSAKEKSTITRGRLLQVLAAWREKMGQTIAAGRGVPEFAFTPFEITSLDTADQGHRNSAIWSRMLPAMLLLWALTGAFYPAVDLCAGEKERGTLETLLCSPAARGEIVCGKLFTVVSFSIGNTLLNLASLGLTSALVMRQLPKEIGAPPPLTPLWLVLALIPMSLLFSALCLALAAFARSSKEGQYYLMPLMVVTMPLVMMPLSPAVELTLGNALIPVTGVVLLLRTMLEGQVWQAMRFAPAVVVVTLGCVVFAVRWAVDQFNRESVLFRESERVDVRLLLRHLHRDRGDVPSPAEAITCGVVILLVKFFMSFVAAAPTTFREFAVLAIATQLVVIATPVLLMTIMLTRSPKQTLAVRLPKWPAIPLAVLLAISIMPVARLAERAVQYLYPVDESLLSGMNQLISQAPNLWAMLFVMALVPALFEELAFRGFILTGLLETGRPGRAILISSIFFGLAHVLLQQTILAVFTGMLIGLLAWQTRSVWPGVFFHFTHNSLVFLVGTLVTPASPGWLRTWLFVDPAGELRFSPLAYATSGLLAIACLWWFKRQSGDKPTQMSTTLPPKLAPDSLSVQGS